jgi:hypothetical protein
MKHRQMTARSRYLLPPMRRSVLAFVATAMLLLLACSSPDHEPRPDQGPEQRSEQGPDQGSGPADSEQQPQTPQEPDVYEEVWSQTSPIGTSWEYKVNCSGDPVTLEPCYLSDLTSIRVVAPDCSMHELEKDFNVNDYSGEVTRRWVLYGPQDGLPPISGEYTFEYRQAGELVRSHTIDYTQSQIGYPTGVQWQRVGNDISVQWDAPSGVEEGMWYKVIIGNEGGTPDAFVSQVFEWDAESATLPDIPLMDGGTYHLSVAVFYGGGYAYPEDEIFDW